MDRSTIIGFLLIAGLLFGYSWLKQPSEEEIAQARIAEAQAKVEQKATDIQPVVVEEPMDSLAQEAKIKSQYGAFASLTNGESEKITLENNLVELQFDTKGGMLSKARLKEYSRYDDKPLVLFDEKDNNFGFIFKPSGRVVNTKDLYFTKEKL